MTHSAIDRRFLLRTALGAVLVPALGLSRIARAAVDASRAPAEVAGIGLPATELALQARDLAKAACPEYLFNHCMRTFLFGAIAASKRNITFDGESLFIAASLHDLGLIEKYQSANAPFEIDSADAAKGFLRDHAVEGQRADLIWDAIAMHALAISSRKAPEVRLLAFGAGTDVFGGGVKLIGEEAVATVLKAFPRAHFNGQFQELILTYCRHKPGAQAGTWTDAFCRSHLPNVQFPTFKQAFAESPFKE
jgi:hypothetical protein